MEKLLSAQQVAEMLKVPIRTIYRWRHVGSGPPAIRVGKYLRYRPGDVEAWLVKQQTRRPA